ncbi:hypothetical protein ABZ345_25240 [Lentzea sp. NPDC005914]|uniref:hypothetical protein n=1 Tax=Lentzea sp. NPDC005914 TaxID=3154572 RepID=UPI0033D7BE84
MEPFLRDEDPADAVRSLPEPARRLFLTLCCITEDDLYTYAVGEADEELAVLSEHGLIEIEDGRLSLHPGAVEAGRAMAELADSRFHVADQLAAIEDQQGRYDRALAFKAEALGLAYAAGDPHVISNQHHDYAVLIARVDTGSPRVLAHYFAAAAIAIRTDAPTLRAEIEMLAMFAFAFGLPEQISLNDDIIALAQEVEGVRLGELLESLSQGTADDLQQLVARAMERAHETMRDWSPLMTAVVLQAEGDTQYASQLTAELAGMEENPGAAPVVHVFRRILAGERGPELLNGLGMLPFGMVSKVLATLRERAGS